MDDAESAKVARENAYLKLRCAQLQGDVTDLSSEVARLRQELERIHGVRESRRANPDAGSPG